MFVQGDPPDEVFCILSGRVEITSTATDGRVRLLAIAAPGDLFGELGILGDMPRSGTAICVADTLAWAVDGQQFLRFLTDQPPAALALLSALSRQVVAQDGLVEDMLFLDLKGRVATGGADHPFPPPVHPAGRRPPSPAGRTLGQSDLTQKATVR
jgi:CRP/FNR family transcriptional regulator, cyclic AMP receptor protein